MSPNAAPVASAIQAGAERVLTYRIPFSSLKRLMSLL